MKIAYTKMMAGVLALIICLGASLASAEDNVYELNNPVQITDQNGTDFRLLFRPDLNLPDSSIIIDRAILEVKALVPGDSALVTVRVCPIIVNWGAESVAWDSPWTDPGGDFDDVNYAEYSAYVNGSQEFGVDITDTFMRWADGRMPYYGFMVGIKMGSDSNVSFVDLPDGNSVARLKVSFTRMTAE